MKYAVDKIIDEIAVIEDMETREMKEVNLELLPEEIQEGNILVYQDNEYFRVITKGTVGSNNHKLVLICKSKEIADSLMNHFRKCRIFTLNGYPLLNNNANTPIAHDIDRRVVEIPLENDKKKFEYIVRCIREFKGHN